MKSSRELTESARLELQRLFTALEDSTDDYGCSADRITVSKSALEALAEAFGTWLELND